MFYHLRYHDFAPQDLLRVFATVEVRSTKWLFRFYTSSFFLGWSARRWRRTVANGGAGRSCATIGESKGTLRVWDEQKSAPDVAHGGDDFTTSTKATGCRHDELWGICFVFNAFYYPVFSQSSAHRTIGAGLPRRTTECLRTVEKEAPTSSAEIDCGEHCNAMFYVCSFAVVKNARSLTGDVFRVQCARIKSRCLALSFQCGQFAEFAGQTADGERIYKERFSILFLGLW